MNEITPTTPMRNELASEPTAERPVRHDLPNWVAPRLEDVSEQVMAQPYIRFT